MVIATKIRSFVKPEHESRFSFRIDPRVTVVLAQPVKLVTWPFVAADSVGLVPPPPTIVSPTVGGKFAYVSCHRSITQEPDWSPRTVIHAIDPSTGTSAQSWVPAATALTPSPKPKDIVRTLIKPKAHRHITSGSTYENKANLANSFFDQLAQYEGTQLGRQELLAEIIDAEEGGIINRSWLQLWPSDKPFPKFDWIVMSLDTAMTAASVDKKTHNADPTACQVWGVFWHEDRTQLMMLDCWQDHLGFPDLLARVKKERLVAYGDEENAPIMKPLIGPARMAGSGRKPDIILIEDKGSGISLRQSLEREGIETYPYNPGNADKLSRLHMVSHIFAQKRVWLPESQKHPKKPRTWCDQAVTQWCSFRGERSIAHDDHVDAMSQAVRLCLDKQLLTEIKKSKPEREREDNERAPRYTPRGNPYAQ